MKSLISTLTLYPIRRKILFAFLFCIGANVALGAETNLSAVLPPPDFRDVKYGPHDRNVLDLWQAKSVKHAPLLVYIHGGGWLGFDKSVIPPRLLNFMLAHGVSVAAINYRYSTMAKLPAPVHDAARAIQFLRSKAGEWKLNPKRIAAMGGSAGACTTLWLAYHDDLVQRKSPDPVARQSSRLCAAVGISGQTSIDPEVIAGWVGGQVLEHPMIWAAVGAKSRDEMKTRAAEYRALYQEFSPINHVSRGDPPVMLLYPTATPLPALDAGTAIHHATFGLKLKEKAEAVGAVCGIQFADLPDQSGVETDAFLLQHLKKK